MTIYDILPALPKRAARAVALAVVVGLSVAPGPTNAFLAQQGRAFGAEIMRPLEQAISKQFKRDSSTLIRKERGHRPPG